MLNKDALISLSVVELALDEKLEEAKQLCVRYVSNPIYGMTLKNFASLIKNSLGNFSFDFVFSLPLNK